MRTVIALSAVLLGSLLGSYLVWTYEGDGLDTEKVAVYAATARDVSALQWTNETDTVTLTRKEDALGTYIWVEHTQQVEVPVPATTEPSADNPNDTTEAPSADEANSEPPKTEFKSESNAFLGGLQAEELMKKYTPLQAIRELPTNSTLDMGLDTPAGTIQITRKSGELRLVVGKETFGGKQRFLKAEDRAFLINKSDVRSFNNPEKLMEGRLHPLNRLSATTITVTSGEQKRTLARQNASDARKSFWANPSTPEERDQTGETWVLKALDIKGKAYVQGAAPEGLTPTMTLDIGDGTDTWSVAISSQVDESGETVYYGKSTFTRTHVKLNAKAADAAADLAAFLSADGS